MEQNVNIRQKGRIMPRHLERPMTPYRRVKMTQWHALRENGYERAASMAEIISTHQKKHKLSDIPTGHVRLCIDTLDGLKSNTGMQNTCTQVHITAKDSRRLVAIRTPKNDLRTSYSPGKGAR